MFEEISLGQFGNISSYNLMVGLGIMSGILFFEKKHSDITEDIKFKLYNILFVSFIFGFIGSHYFELIYFSKDITLNNLLSGVSTFMGGLFSSLLVSLISTYLYRLNYLSTINTFIPFIVISHFFGRIGCFLAGCCFGKETSCEYIGVTFPEHSIPYYHYGGNVIIHPTQLYEALGLIVILYFIRNKQNKISPYLIMYGSMRFAIEFLRNDDRGMLWITDLSPSQMFSILFIMIGLGLLNFKKYDSLVNLND